MDFVFLMMKGATILSVKTVDLENEDLTIDAAALQLMDEFEMGTDERPDSYAVLGCTRESVWLLQQSTEGGTQLEN